MKKSIAKNYIYNLIYQMLTILLPLITTPYLSRVLGAKNIGIYGYTASIVTYFILFGTLGVSMYGQREMAYRQDDKQQRSKSFYEIIILRTITLTISILLFYLVYGRTGEYVIYYRILVIQLLANVVDISWFFQGLEEFDKTVIRNVIVKFLSLILIFVLVKTQNDLWKYILIYVGAELLGNITLWFYMPRYLEKVNIKSLELTRHVKPILTLFLPQIAIQIYTVLDRTMIGQITGDMEEVGYYEQAQRIIKSTLSIISAFHIVMNSRTANAYARQDNKEIKDGLRMSFNFGWFLSIPMMFGIMAIATKFVPWFYGEGFEGVIPVLIATSPILVAISVSGVTGTQYLAQIGMQKILTKSVTIGAVVNIILNSILIPRFGGMGAAIASVIAEVAVVLAQLKYLREQFTLLEILKLSTKCFISGIIMFIVVSVLANYMSVSILNTIIQIVIGITVYVGILIILRYQFLCDILKQILRVIKPKN